ncbi:MAG: MFS transporter [Candidatus Paceibacterota bacterium]|jgi:MFS family permease
MKIRISLDIKDLTVNRVIRHFILSDLLLLGGWGIISPVFGLFIIDSIRGANIFSVGVSVGIYFITKSIVQLPVAVLLDKKQNERISFYVLISSLMLAGFSAMAYGMVSTVVGLYIVSALQGFSFGLYTPSWSGMFSRHLDNGHCSLDWSLDSATIGIASGIAAIFGGFIATTFGFTSMFIVAAIFSFVGAITLLAVPHLIFPNKIPTKMNSGEHVHI